jgi:hypothetical protein
MMHCKQFVAGFCLMAASVGVCAAAAEAPLSSPAAVEQRVRAWQPTEQERRWEKIGWAKDIRDALRLAKTANRPVFLFTLDGRMSVGRC